jgi:dihydroorotase
MDPCEIYFATKDFICHRLEIANDERNLDAGKAAAALEQHGDIVVGFKVRACSTTDPDRSPFLEVAQQVAYDRPVMVHLGRFPFTPTIPTRRLLAQLRAGDVITHAFRGASGVLDEHGKATPELSAAVDRGVLLDVGHSGTDFRFSAARRMFSQGLVPTTVSTDLNVFNLDHPVRSLAETLSKMWFLGLPLLDVIAMATSSTARTIRRDDELGRLEPGRVAEVSVLRIDEGPAELSDGVETVVADQRLVPVGCLRAGTWIDATAA